jgi:hypothetical protein
MSAKHWFGAVVILLIGVYLGMKQPQLFSAIPGLGS